MNTLGSGEICGSCYQGPAAEAPVLSRRMRRRRAGGGGGEGGGGGGERSVWFGLMQTVWFGLVRVKRYALPLSQADAAHQHFKIHTAYQEPAVLWHKPSILFKRQQTVLSSLAHVHSKFVMCQFAQEIRKKLAELKPRVEEWSKIQEASASCCHVAFHFAFRGSQDRALPEAAEFLTSTRPEPARSAVLRQKLKQHDQLQKHYLDLEVETAPRA